MPRSRAKNRNEKTKNTYLKILLTIVNLTKSFAINRSHYKFFELSLNWQNRLKNVRVTLSFGKSLTCQNCKLDKIIRHKRITDKILWKSNAWLSRSKNLRLTKYFEKSLAWQNRLKYCSSHNFRWTMVLPKKLSKKCFELENSFNNR